MKLSMNITKMTPEEAVRIIQYEWRYYLFFNYDVCGECGYGGKSIGCGCSEHENQRWYDAYFDINEEI